MAQSFQQWIGLDRGEAGITLLVGTLQPFEGLIGFPAKRILLSDLKGRISVMLGDKLDQDSIRILFSAERVVNQYFGCEFRPLAWFLLNFRERLLRLSLRDENQTQSEMGKGSLRAQLQSFSQLGLSFVASTRQIHKVSQPSTEIAPQPIH